MKNRIIILLLLNVISCKKGENEIIRYNIFSNVLYGAENIYDESIGNYPSQLNNGQLHVGVGVDGNKLEKEVFLHNKYHKGLKLKNKIGLFLSSKKGSTLASKDLPILSIYTPSDYIKNRDSYSLGFWINVKKLNGNGIAFKDVNGTASFLSNEKLKIVGSKAYNSDNINNNHIFEISKIEGDYSYLKYNLNNTYVIRFYPYKISGKTVREFEILNLTFLDGKEIQIDPYKYYKSEAEVLKSNKIGKLAVIVGDSQHQDREIHRVISRRTGLNIISQAKGGHSIKYRHLNSEKPNMFWFYEKTLNRDVIQQIKGVDYYILPLSTNDGSGGGELSNATIQEVIDNYPFYGDSEDTVIRKLEIFSSMDEAERECIFGYKQTFAAYIMQLYLINPNAKLILTSIPISPGNMTGKADTNGKGQWQEGKTPINVSALVKPRYDSISDDSQELAYWFSTNWVDLRNEVGLSFDNAVNYTIDGTHWNKEIKKRIGLVLSQELDKM